MVHVVDHLKWAGPRCHKQVMKVEIKSHDSVLLCMSLYEITIEVSRKQFGPMKYVLKGFKVLFHVSVESLSHQIWQYIHVTCNVLLAMH